MSRQIVKKTSLRHLRLWSNIHSSQRIVLRTHLRRGWLAGSKTIWMTSAARAIRSAAHSLSVALRLLMPTSCAPRARDVGVWRAKPLQQSMHVQMVRAMQNTDFADGARYTQRTSSRDVAWPSSLAGWRGAREQGHCCFSPFVPSVCQSLQNRALRL